jgi:hypothetical protein
MSEEKLKQQIAFLESKLAYYEEDGPAKLYYSLIRKSNEMAELLNRTSLLSIELVDAKNKEFERLQKLWTDAGSITASIKALEVSAGINVEPKEGKKEVAQVINRPFTPESVADAVGEIAGSKQ